LPGFRVGVGPRGTRIRASIPGTGIYYHKQIGKKRNKKNDIPFQSEQNDTACSIDEPAITFSSEELEKRDKIVNNLRQNILKDAISLLSVNHFQESLLKFKSALKLTKKSADIFYFIGLIDYKFGHPRKTIKNLLKALDYVDFLGADIPIQKIKFKATLQYSKNAVFPILFDHKSLILLLAKSLEDIGQIKRSNTLLREYFKHNRSDEIVLNALMVSLIEKKDFVGVIKEFESNKLSQPTIWKACAFLAVQALMAIGETEKAKKIEDEIQSNRDFQSQAIFKKNQEIIYNDFKNSSKNCNSPDIHNPQIKYAIEPVISDFKEFNFSDEENCIGRLYLLIGLFLVNSKNQVSQEDVKDLIENKKFQTLYGGISKADILHYLREYTEKEEFNNINQHISATIIDEETRKRLMSYAIDVALRDFSITQEEINALEHLAELLKFDKKYLPSFIDQTRIEYFKRNWQELSTSKKLWLIEELNKMGLHAKNIGTLFEMTSREIRKIKDTHPLKRMSEEEQQRIVQYLSPGDLKT
jgi:hypothetical protein